MEDRDLLKIDRYLGIELVKDAVFFCALYAISREFGLFLFVCFVLSSVWRAFDKRKYLQNIFKNLSVNTTRGIIFWDGHGCDVEISGFSIWSYLELTYMEGMNRRMVRIPSTVFSSTVWQQLVKYRT
ncbi:hypothetical protein [uncultured Vibrio sp.]|uniref:hypothetical protein n=1 Tax=uncultured Vibrio sp. TaxID=114054 RepID=UPI002AAAF50E|nr:hypothetical protein [uncultured Vibrio sp.]